MIENSLSVNSVNQIDSVKRTEPAFKPEEKEGAKIPKNRDEYVPSEEKEPIGLYSVSPDENGAPLVSLDDEKSKSDAPDDPKGDTITANTDKVDSEIKALRDKEQALRQRLRSADEKAAENIARELEKITAELAQKDNDEYRRQNAVFT